MKRSLFLILICSSLWSFDTQELYKQAQTLEKNGNYKEAMFIYKQIAKSNMDIKVQKEDDLEIVKENLQVKNEVAENIKADEEKKSISEILSSSFDIYAYKENYFLPISYDLKKRVNREQSEAKFQISIKKPILENVFGFGESINIGYTQTSWWQIYKDSAPFRETNYQPEVFVTVPYTNAHNSMIKEFKAGLLHESNGQGGENSRSWNRVYLEAYLESGNLLIIPRVWHRFKERSENDNNPQTSKFYGYGDLTLVYPYSNNIFKLQVRNNLRLNRDNKGFAQFDWSFPFFGLKNTYGYLQLSSGYGDSLIDYDKEVNRVSFGISLSR